MYYDCLKGITMNALGDSYFAGNGLESELVWPALLAKKYEMSFCNYGKNGSTVSDFVTENHPMVHRLSGMAENNADLILLDGGRNDYNKGTPIGDENSTDSKTVMGALNIIIEGLKKKYPRAVIICITVWRYNGKNSLGLGYEDYADAVKRSAKKHGLPCFDASDPSVSGVDMTDESFRATYCMKPNDVSHLNEAGMKLVLPRFESFIAKALT